MSDDTMQDIINRIKSRRMELGYSFQDLADLTEMSKSTLQRYETGGIKNIPLDKLKILATALKVTPEWIMGWDEVSKDECDDEINEYLEELHKRPEMKTLFSVAKKATKEDIEKAVKIIEMFKDNR